MALGAAREIHQPGHVGERLLSRRPVRQAGVGAGRGEQAADRVRQRMPVAAAMQLAKNRERRADLGERRRQVGGERTERVQAAEALAKREQRAVAEREERTAQRREHREIVLGSLDRGERVADRLDLLALVERAAADQHVRQLARFQGSDVEPGHVAPVGTEAAEEDADVARLDRDPTIRPLALGHRPAAPVDEPVRRTPPSHRGASLRSANRRRGRSRRTAPGPAARRSPAASHRRTERARGARTRPGSATAPASATRTPRSPPVGSREPRGSSPGGTRPPRRPRPAAASPTRRARRRRGESDRSTASGRRPERAFPESAAPASSRSRRDRRTRAGGGSRPGADRCPGTRRRRGA